MEVDCEGCAGCCIDWRAVAPDGIPLDHERRGPYRPLDGSYNLVPLSGDEVRGFVRAGLGDVLIPRLWAGGGGPSVEVDGQAVAAVESRPIFFIGLRKARKPVAPFGLNPTWLPTCVFLDPTSLQCRLHGGERYPDACARYPGDNLALDAETECERVEQAFGGERLLDDDPGDVTPLLAPSAMGGRVFAHPERERIAGRVGRIARGEAIIEDRAEFVGVAAGSRPGTLDVDTERYERARERVLEADSWAGRAIEAWSERAASDPPGPPDPALGRRVEDARGAPPTPGCERDGNTDRRDES